MPFEFFKRNKENPQSISRNEKKLLQSIYPMTPLKEILPEYNEIKSKYPGVPLEKAKYLHEFDMSRNYLLEINSLLGLELINSGIPKAWLDKYFEMSEKQKIYDQRSIWLGLITYIEEFITSENSPVQGKRYDRNVIFLMIPGYFSSIQKDSSKDFNENFATKDIAEDVYVLALNNNNKPFVIGQYKLVNKYDETKYPHRYGHNTPNLIPVKDDLLFPDSLESNEEKIITYPSNPIDIIGNQDKYPILINNTEYKSMPKMHTNHLERYTKYNIKLNMLEETFEPYKTVYLPNNPKFFRTTNSNGDDLTNLNNYIITNRNLFRILNNQSINVRGLTEDEWKILKKLKYSNRHIFSISSKYKEKRQFYFDYKDEDQMDMESYWETRCYDITKFKRLLSNFNIVE